MSRKSSIYLSICSMVILIVLYVLTASGWLGGIPVGEEGSYGAPLVIPESYAFTIWIPIYLFLIIFPFYQLFKKQEDHTASTQIRVWYSLNVIANGIWLVLASHEWLLGTVLVIIFMLISLIKINELLLNIKSNGTKINFWFEQIGFSLYFGWITLATVLNISAALKYYQWEGFGISDVSWSLIILPIAALIATFTFRKYRDVGYALVIIWAFIAIIIKHLDANFSIAFLSIAIVASFIGLIFTEKMKMLRTGRNGI